MRTGPLNIMILGANGFIGSALSAAILANRPWHVYGIDLADHKLGAVRQHPRFHFVEGDITINREWVEYHIRKCDVVIPLVAIANPAQYVTEPLRVFELDFEANLVIVRSCVKYHKRLVFPVDVRSLRHVAGRAARRGVEPAGLRPDQQAALDLRRIQAAARSRHPRLRRDATGSTTRCSARSISSVRTSTTSTSRRKAARASSRSSCRTSSTASPSSSSTAARRSGRSRISTTASTA